jgi:hypothetical protein
MVLLLIFKTEAFKGRTVYDGRYAISVRPVTCFWQGADCGGKSTKPRGS